MSHETAKQKQFLFVDDNADFLMAISDIFKGMSRGTWSITTAGNHAQALELLNHKRMDVVVLDVGMPVMNGVQLLRLLGRAHPGQQVVMLTGMATEQNQKECTEAGAALVLEKPAKQEEFASVFAALDSLANAQPQEGFHGLMRRVGLHEVLQLECLGRKSSVLEIFTSKVRGRIFIRDGGIEHAESGVLQGEVALYSLLALRGGQFNLLPFAEPPRRTIKGNWEVLLMEAARLHDERSQPVENEPARSDAGNLVPPAGPEASPDIAPPAAADEAGAVRIEEVVLCSGTGEVLYHWECPLPESRLRLIEQVEQQADELNTLAPVGHFDRLEIQTPGGRIVCQAQGHRRLWVRSAPAKTANA